MGEYADGESERDRTDAVIHASSSAPSCDTKTSNPPSAARAGVVALQQHAFPQLV